MSNHSTVGKRKYVTLAIHQKPGIIRRLERGKNEVWLWLYVTVRQKVQSKKKY
jgi:hypothetical protein